MFKKKKRSSLKSIFGSVFMAQNRSVTVCPKSCRLFELDFRICSCSLK